MCFGKVSATADRDGDGYCMVQENGVIFWSDDGHQWHRAAQYVSGKLRCLDFYSRSNGVAAGDVTAGKQNIVYTTDGGKSWQGGDVSFNVRSVCMTSNNTAMLVGDGGNIAYYRLGGDATLLSSPVATRLNSVSFFGNTGYACGEEGTLLKYESGVWKSLKYEDKDWVAATDPSERGISCTLNAIVAVDAQTVYAGGDNGVLLKTVDGGCEWSRRDVETTNNLTAITLKPDGDLSINAGGRLLTVKDNTDLYSVKMYYDRLGRVVASQNSKQHAMRPQRFSYTLYDRSGRNVESGELESDAEPTDAIINSTDVRFPDNWSKKRYQVVRSVYTDPIYGEDEDDKVFLAFGSGQKNLRNRIATTLYQEVYDPSSKKYDHATHYSHDVHGNICQVVYDRPELEGIGHRFKKIEYDYNLITSQVNRMDYQSGNPDGYSLKYLYDSENRLEKVYYKSVGESESEWHELASYEYYRHGPLARMVLGDTLQGVDYAYTLQGWIKGVNLEKEQGEGVRQDVYGYTMQYNTEDYKPIGNSTFNPTVDAGAANLYNGNISAMTTKLMGKPSLSEGNFMGAQTRRFVYDELNRLKESMVQSNSPSASAYHTSYAYDSNGNIVRLTRNDQNGAAMDNLTYHYAQDAYGKRINNRLLHVNDAVSGDEGADIKNQGTYTPHKPSTHNYAYDEVGNLIKDKAEEVAEIKWTVTGKVSEVIRLEDSDKPDLRFAYDGLGHRISKTVYHKHAALGDKVQTTYYVRDLQGNVLAVYEHKHAEGESGTFTLAEQHLYGASRIGMTKPNLALNTTTPEAPVPTIHYELTNHLGNVMAVITDEPAATETPAVESLTDYYPFGMTMPGRSYNASDYRYGFNGQEKETEDVLCLDYGSRLYNSGLARWRSLDPQSMSYPDFSPYSYCAGNPIVFIDKKGETIWIYYMDQKGKEQRVDYRDLEKIKEINNEFVNKTVLAFEQIKSWSNEADDRYNFKKDIDFVSNNEMYAGFPLVYEIKEGTPPSADPYGHKTIIEVDNKYAMVGQVNGESTVALPPSASLFHEFFEQWRCFHGAIDPNSDFSKWYKEIFSGLPESRPEGMSDEEWNEILNKKSEIIGKFDTESDMYIIKILESYVANKYYGNSNELYRDSHRGANGQGFVEYESKSVNSVEPLKK